MTIQAFLLLIKTGENMIKFNKIFSIIIALNFLITFIGSPVLANISVLNGHSGKYNRIFSEFILSTSCGKITQTHFTNSDRVIINIQDLHCHPKVQKNIGNIIETIDKKYGINKIYLEGAYGQVSTKWLTDKINDYKKEEILNKILETGRLTGAEYYSAKSGRSEIIKGLEKKEPYLENIKRFGSIIENQEKINLILQAIEEDSQKLKKRYFTKRQFKLEELSKKFKEDKISSQKYYNLLSKHIDKLGIDLTKYENTFAYITLLNLQSKLNFSKVTRQMQNLILELKETLPYETYRLLLDNTENFSKADKLYEYIMKLCREMKIDLNAEYAELNKYFGYLELSQKINPLKLISEETKLTQEINTRFSETKVQRDIVFMTNFEKYLKNYVTSKITSDDYVYYKENIDTYKQLWDKYVDNRVLSMLDEYIDEVDKFYKVNLDRNLYFAENLFSSEQKKGTINDETTKNNFSMSSLRGDFSTKQSSARSAVIADSDPQSMLNKTPFSSSNIPPFSEAKRVDIVITGGFHSQTVTEILKNHNVSYIVITPNVSDGIDIAEKTYYQLAKEQSKISFQTLAPAIASLSSQTQQKIIDILDNPQQKQEISKLDEEAGIKLISDLAAAKILESDDLGSLEDSLQRIVKDIVDDIYKEKITPELILKIKNLQNVLNDKEELQKIIDLLQEGQTKQSIILISDVFDRVYKIFDSFIFSKTKQLKKEEMDAYQEKIDDKSKEDADSEENEKKYDIQEEKALNSNIKRLQRKVIVASEYNNYIINWIRENKVTDKQLLNRVLSELKILEPEQKQTYCKVISLLKKGEDIFAFLVMDKMSRNNFMDICEYALDDYSDQLSSYVLQSLLNIIKKHGYSRRDFDDLYNYCGSRFIAVLNTQENISDFLNLDFSIRRNIFNFYEKSEDDFDINFNSLKLKFILMLIKDVNYSIEDFKYLMKLICRLPLKEDNDDDIEFVESFKGKKINEYILQNFKYFEFYNKYVMDLLFSDFDETYTNNFDFQKFIDLIDALQKYKIDSLELENKAFSLVVFFSKSLEKYCEENNITDLARQYQLAIRVSRRIYAIAGDNIFTILKYDMEDIIKETLQYYKEIDKIIALISLFDNKTAVFSIHNDEKNSDQKTQRFTSAGLEKVFNKVGITPGYFEYIEISFINKVLDFINSFEQNEIDKEVLLNFLDGIKGSVVVKETIQDYIKRSKKDFLSKKSLIRYIRKIRFTETMVEANRFLGNIENFNSFGLEKGVFVFDGHGSEEGFFYSDGKTISVKQISRALINAHNNGVNLENITLMFLSCHSYKFSGNVINELINAGIKVFPQIITDAGKETVFGYTKMINTDDETIKVSNLFYSLIKFLDSKTQEELEKMNGFLSFKDVADAPRYSSNNTIFVTNGQIDELNHSLEQTIRSIIEKVDDSSTRRIYPIMEKDGMYVAADYNKYAQLLLPKTEKILNIFGNTKIIKTLYKDNAGNNFKNTRLGTAIGVILETFVFWKPNFITMHNFTPEQQAGTKAVVWRIRALSIGIGLIRIIPLMITPLSPLTFSFVIVPYAVSHFVLTTLTTANILHYFYDRQQQKEDIREIPFNVYVSTRNILEEENKIIVVADTEQQAEQIKKQVSADITAVSMEIIYSPKQQIRGGKLLDVSTDIRAKYDKTKSKLIIYSKQGIEINEQQIKDIIRDYYYQSRKESYSNHIIIFTDSPNDIENKINSERTSLITMPIKEIKYDISARNITDISAVCKNEEIVTGARTFIISREQTEYFAEQIKHLQETGYNFIISSAEVYELSSDEVRISAVDNNLLTEEYLETILRDDDIKSIVIDNSCEMFIFKNKSKLFTNSPAINIEMQYITVTDSENSLQFVTQLLAAS